jgi:hypothetical protein
MSIQDIRDARKIPAKIGGRVRYTGDKQRGPMLGTIVGTHNGYLRIRLDGDCRRAVASYHPTWELEFMVDAWCPDCDRETPHRRLSPTCRECTVCGELSADIVSVPCSVDSPA